MGYQAKLRQTLNIFATFCEHEPFAKLSILRSMQVTFDTAYRICKCVD